MTTQLTTQRPARILVVDADESLTSVLAVVMDLEGWQTYVAADAPTALAAIDEFEPDFVLMDGSLAFSLPVPVVYVSKPFGIEEIVERLNPMVRKLGLAPSSRRFADLVLDDTTAEVWRGDQRVLLTPLEFELLRALVVEPETPMSLGQVLLALTRRGARVPRELAVKMFERMRRLVNSDRSPLVHVDASGSWMLALA